MEASDSNDFVYGYATIGYGSGVTRCGEDFETMCSSRRPRIVRGLLALVGAMRVGEEDLGDCGGGSDTESGYPTIAG